MIKCTILIPTAYNDDRPVSVALLQGYRRKVAVLCGGYTDAGFVTGAWVEKNMPMQVERNIELWVVCEPTLLPQLRVLAGQIARDLEQDSVYLEWHETNIEFVPSPQRKKL